MKTNTVLTVGAHPADFINSAGTLANHIKQGDIVFIVVLTHGINSHFRNEDIKSESIANLSNDETSLYQRLKDEKKRETIEAARIIGINENNLIFLDYDDGPLLTEKRIIYDVAIRIRRIKPNIMITHLPTENDHEDHQSAGDIGTRAVKAAANYISGCEIKPHFCKNIYFMMPSYINKFRSFGHVLQAPDVIIDISSVIELKREACMKFKSQKFTPGWANKIWECVNGLNGIMHGFDYAESFISMFPVNSQLLPDMTTRTIYDWQDEVYSSSKKQ